MEEYKLMPIKGNADKIKNKVRTRYQNIVQSSYKPTSNPQKPVRQPVPRRSERYNPVYVVKGTLQER